MPITNETPKTDDRRTRRKALLLIVVVEGFLLFFMASGFSILSPMFESDAAMPLGLKVMLGTVAAFLVFQLVWLPGTIYRSVLKDAKRVAAIPHYGPAKVDVSEQTAPSLPASAVALRPEVHNLFTLLFGGLVIGVMTFGALFMVAMLIVDNGPDVFFAVIWIGGYLVGLWFVGNMFLKRMFLGKTTLKVSADRVRGGETINVQFYQGRRFTIRQLAIDLVMRQQYTGGEGSSYKTVRTIPLLEQNNVQTAGKSEPTLSFSAEIPYEVLPTSTVDKVETVWDIRVQMHNKSRPNYKDHFRITVLP